MLRSIATKLRIYEAHAMNSVGFSLIAHLSCRCSAQRLMDQVHPRCPSRPTDTSHPQAFQPDVAFCRIHFRTANPWLGNICRSPSKYALGTSGGGETSWPNLFLIFQVTGDISTAPGTLPFKQQTTGDNATSKINDRGLAGTLSTPNIVL